MSASDATEERRVRLRIAGRVQGVAFRAAACDEARSLGLSGWVRNLPDGDVEVVLQGEPGTVERMIAWCRRGPSLARVSRVDVDDEPPEPDTAPPFEVRF